MENFNGSFVVLRVAIDDTVEVVEGSQELIGVSEKHWRKEWALSR